MHGRQFDDLAKAMAAGMSRRKAISGLFRSVMAALELGSCWPLQTTTKSARSRASRAGRMWIAAKASAAITAAAGSTPSAARTASARSRRRSRRPCRQNREMSACPSPGAMGPAVHGNAARLSRTANTTVNRCMKATGFTECSDEVCTSSEGT